MTPYSHLSITLRAVASLETNSITCTLKPSMRSIIARKESVSRSQSLSLSIPCLSSPANSREEFGPIAFCSSCWQQGAERMYLAFHSTPFASASSVAVSHACRETTMSTRGGIV